MSTWKLLESFLVRHVLPEEKMYRGETLIRMKDIRALFAEIGKPDKKTGKVKSSDPTIQSDPNPQGGSVVCSYPVDARVWGRWSRSPDFAKILAGTDKKDTQNVGQAKGGMMVKQNYGGKVQNQPGKAGKDFDTMHSAMDRYDVLMVADVRGGNVVAPDGRPELGNINHPPDQKDGAPEILVRKIVWSPSIGTAEERQERLTALLNGQVPPPVRRAQPEIPVAPKGGQEFPEPVSLPRVGQTTAAPGQRQSATDDDDMPRSPSKGYVRKNPKPSWLK